jgi:hypothetical protein
MAQGSIWGALALADVEALDWAEVRGLSLRHLRWWSERPISDRDGVLSVGYGYDNRRMAESYNSAGSPYWCMKAFTMLAAPDDHPFWTVDEATPPPPRTISLRAPGMVLGHDDDQVVGLFAQPRGWSFVEQADAKYQKFAYSSRFGFSGDFTMYGLGATDSMLAVTDPATSVRKVREVVLLSEVADGVALTRWCPMAGVRVDTALVGGAPWHVRVHRVVTDRELALSETGFALGWEPTGFAAPPVTEPELGTVWLRTSAGATTMVDLPRVGASTRRAELLVPSPNANVMHPHTVVPALATTVPAGCHWLVCAVGASSDAGRVSPDGAPVAEQLIFDRLDAFVAREVPS